VSLLWQTELSSPAFPRPWPRASHQRAAGGERSSHRVRQHVRWSRRQTELSTPERRNCSRSTRVRPSMHTARWLIVGKNYARVLEIWTRRWSAWGRKVGR